MKLALSSQQPAATRPAQRRPFSPALTSRLLIARRTSTCCARRATRRSTRCSRPSAWASSRATCRGSTRTRAPCTWSCSTRCSCTTSPATSSSCPSSAARSGRRRASTAACARARCRASRRRISSPSSPTPTRARSSGKMRSCTSSCASSRSTSATWRTARRRPSNPTRPTLALALRPPAHAACRFLATRAAARLQVLAAHARAARDAGRLVDAGAPPRVAPTRAALSPRARAADHVRGRPGLHLPSEEGRQVQAGGEGAGARQAGQRQLVEQPDRVRRLRGFTTGAVESRAWPGNSAPGRRAPAAKECARGRRERQRPKSAPAGKERERERPPQESASARPLPRVAK